jgi:hypothetical protein
MDTIRPVVSNDRLFPLPLLRRLPIEQPIDPRPARPSAPPPRLHAAGAGLPALLAGLQANFQGPPEEDLGERVESASESAEAVTENVTAPSNQAATLSKAVSEGKTAERVTMVADKLGGDSGKASRALEGLNKVGDKAGKLADGAGVVAKPLSIANNVNTLVTAKDTEDKASAATSLASDVSYTARTVGAAAEGGSGASKLASLASAQSKVAAAAPGAAGVAAKVGKAAPVVGGVAGVVSGGLDLKDAVQGGEKDKFATGGLKVASGVAMMVPGGMPIAMGLGAAALAIEHRETIAKGAKAVGKGVAKGAEAVGGAAKKGAETVGSTAKKGVEAAGKVAGGVGKALGLS